MSVYIITYHHSPQSRLAGTDASIFFGYGRFKLSMIWTNSPSDLVSRGFRVRSSSIELERTDNRQSNNTQYLCKRQQMQEESFVFMPAAESFVVVGWIHQAVVR